MSQILNTSGVFSHLIFSFLREGSYLAHGETEAQRSETYALSSRCSVNNQTQIRTGGGDGLSGWGPPCDWSGGSGPVLSTRGGSCGHTWWCDNLYSRTENGTRKRKQELSKWRAAPR